MEKLTIAEQIRILANRKGMSISALGAELGKSPANMLNQLKRDDFRVSDLEKIAEALGVRLVCEFKENGEE